MIQNTKRTKCCKKRQKNVQHEKFLSTQRHKLQRSNSSVTVVRTAFLLQEVVLRDNWLTEVTREFTLDNTFLTAAHGYNESSTDICIL